MTLEELINKDVIDAMKAKSELKLQTLRMLKSAIKSHLIDNKLDKASDEDVLRMIVKQIKQRKDSIEEYNKANREDLAKKEQDELDILKVYQPEQMSNDELKPIVEKVLKDNNIETKAQMGQAMKLIMAEVGGKADGKAINQIVASLLA